MKMSEYQFNDGMPWGYEQPWKGDGSPKPKTRKGNEDYKKMLEEMGEGFYTEFDAEKDPYKKG